MGSLHQGQVVADFHADATCRASVVIDFKDGMPEGGVSAWRLVAQNIFFRRDGLFACNGGEFVAVLWEVPRDQGLAQVVAGLGIGEERVPEVIVEPAINFSERFQGWHP